MTNSKELANKLKEVKKIEKSIKLLEKIKKDMLALHKVDYNSYSVITDKFDDTLYYDISDKVNKLKDKLQMLVN